MEYLTWSTLPQHILLHIFTQLPMNDRLNASLACKNWSDCFHHPKLWSKFVFKFDTDIDNEGKAVACIEKYCDVLKNVEIYINQSQKISRERACYVIDELTTVAKKKLQKFAFHFTGHNPLCFNGNSILRRLKKLFSHESDAEIVFHLTFVDLNHCNIAFDNDLISTFAKYHQCLRIVRIQNSCLVDNVTSSSILKLIKSCPLLEELHTFYHCVDADVIEALGGDNRTPFRYLSLFCNRSDKFNELVPTTAWMKLAVAHPFARVAMRFHHSTPHHIIIPLLSPGIPLIDLDLKVYGWLADEIAHVSAMFSSTLECLSLNPSMDLLAKASPGLEPSLLDLVSRCDKLKELHCHCMLQEEVINSIKAMRSLTKYTLY